MHAPEVPEPTESYHQDSGARIDTNQKRTTIKNQYSQERSRHVREAKEHKP